MGRIQRRETAKERRTVFVVGSALARDQGGGVADVGELTQPIHEKCGVVGQGKTDAARYQDAFGRLKDEASAELVLGPMLFPLGSGAGAEVTPMVLVPDMVSNHYSSDGPGSHGTATRTQQGWEVPLEAAAATKPAGASWSGYGWALAAVVDAAEPYQALHIVVAASSAPMEVEMKLERRDNACDKDNRTVKTGGRQGQSNCKNRVGGE